MQCNNSTITEAQEKKEKTCNETVKSVKKVWWVSDQTFVLKSNNAFPGKCLLKSVSFFLSASRRFKQFVIWRISFFFFFYVSVPRSISQNETLAWHNNLYGVQNPSVFFLKKPCWLFDPSKNFFPFLLDSMSNMATSIERK